MGLLIFLVDHINVRMEPFFEPISVIENVLIKYVLVFLLLVLLVILQDEYEGLLQLGLLVHEKFYDRTLNKVVEFNEFVHILLKNVKLVLQITLLLQYLLIAFTQFWDVDARKLILENHLEQIHRAYFLRNLVY